MGACLLPIAVFVMRGSWHEGSAGRLVGPCVLAYGAAAEQHPVTMSPSDGVVVEPQGLR